MNFKLIFFRTVVLLRILAALFILLNPLWGLIISWILDYFDSYVWVQYAKMSWDEYRVFDKRIDLFGYLMMLFVSFAHPAFFMLYMLLIYRFVGYLLFLYTRNKSIFLVFPNLFEVFFIWQIILPAYFGLDLASINAVYFLILLIVAKEIQELWINYPGQLPFRQFEKPLLMRIYNRLKK